MYTTAKQKANHIASNWQSSRQQQIENKLEELNKSTASPWSDDEEEQAEACEVISEKNNLLFELQQIREDIGRCMS